MATSSRPIGITILAILDLIGGVLILLGGLAVAAVGGSGSLDAFGLGAFDFIAGAIGGFLAVIGILAIVVGWGMWTGKGWAWILAVILYGIGALFSLVSVVFGAFTDIVSLLIDALLLWYMFRPDVKAFFRRKMAV